ncbi:MAG: hypothetical protein CMK32_15720 [Porticoccaceae bacterium]|nr:hypothetical protein [Porticoccaceae bacterium]
MSYQLLKTRLNPPSFSGSQLTRPRLTDLAARLPRHRITVVQAPAGYGKTSLLLQWFHWLSERHQSAAWLTIDSSVEVPVDLVSYLAAALTGSCKGAGDRLTALLKERQQYHTSEEMITALVNALKDGAADLVLFIDDAHRLSGDLLALLDRFIELMPVGLSVVVASRCRLALSLASVRARGELLEIGASDLRFTTTEAVDLLNDAGKTLNAEAVEDLLRRTDGWITGIQLALRGRSSDPALLANFSGQHHYFADYFAEQVFDTQPETIRDFLLKTALLDRFSAGLCDHMLDIRQSRQIIDLISAEGLFLVGLDNERIWYRYHPLFREFLNRQLADSGFQRQSRLLLRATDWLREKGELEAAMECALAAGYPGRAAEILETCSQDWAYKGRIDRVMHFVERIPMAELHHYPTVMLTWAWHLMRHFHFEQAQELLEAVRQRVEDWENISTIPSVDLEQLKHQLLHREMTLAAAKDDPLQVEQRCQQLLALVRHDLHPYLLGSVYAQQLYAQREQFNFSDIESLAAKARGVLHRSGYDFALISVLSVIGASFFAMGKAEAAIQTLEEGMTIAARYGGDRASLSALPALPLSAICYERNDTDRAGELLSRYSDNATDWGLVDQFLSVATTKARLLGSQGEDQEALGVLEEAMPLALDRDLERLRLSLVVEQMRIFSRGNGAAGRIAALAKSAGIPAEKEQLQPKINRFSVDELQALAWMRLAMVTDQVVEAAHLARNWRGFCEARGAHYSYIRWSILLAQALQLAEGGRVAQRVLREALTAAAPMGVMRSFLDEGAPIRTLLEQCCQAGSETSGPTDRFALQLLKAFGGALPAVSRLDSDEGIFGSLTDRELEVLQQVSVGLRNREVAERLGMTEGSIKWYMQQIFDKLGTRSRLQAVERARRLGFIS